MQYPAPIVTHAPFEAPRVSVTFQTRQVGPEAWEVRFSGTVFGKEYENRRTAYPFHAGLLSRSVDDQAFRDLDLSENLSMAGRGALAPALAAIYGGLV